MQQKSFSRRLAGRGKEMYIYLMIGVYVLTFLFLEWHARGVFIACAYCRRYGHGKSYNRANRHYKSNWTFSQRMLWIPMFREYYEDKYKIIAYLSYIHATICFLCVALFLVSVAYFPNEELWGYEMLFYLIVFLIRFIYDNAIARGEI